MIAENNQISGSCNYKHIFVPKFELLRLLTKCIKKKKKEKEKLDPGPSRRNTLPKGTNGLSRNLT